MKDEVTLGTKIKKARVIKKLSQNALAEALNISQQGVANWEKDKNKPDDSILQKLCETIELDYEKIKEKYYTNKDDIKKALKRKKVIKYSSFIMLIILLIVSFIVMTIFIINRNKIEIYYGQLVDENINMSDTILIKTHDKYIIKLGTIIDNQDNYDKVEIFFESNHYKNNVISYSYENNYYVIKDKSFFDIHLFNIKYVYVTFTTKDGNDITSKINFKKLYTYNGIFNSKLWAYY